MCVACGDMEHFDNSFFSKAIEKKKLGNIKNKDEVRYPVALEYEKLFKKNYETVIKEGVDAFLDIIKE